MRFGREKRRTEPSPKAVQKKSMEGKTKIDDFLGDDEDESGFSTRTQNVDTGHFQLEYKNNACKPGMREEIVEIVMNGLGTRDTEGVLGISKDTVTKILKTSGLEGGTFSRYLPHICYTSAQCRV